MVFFWFAASVRDFAKEYTTSLLVFLVGQQSVGKTSAQQVDYLLQQGSWTMLPIPTL